MLNPFFFFFKHTNNAVLKSHVVKRVQNVSDRPPSRFQKLPNFFFFPGRISCVWREETQLEVSGYLELRLDFLPSHSHPQSKEVENPQSTEGKPSDMVFGGIIYI